MATFNYKERYERYKKYYLSLEPILNKPSNQAYTTVIFSFLVVSLFGWYAIRPTMQTIFTLRREISDRTSIDKQMEDKISALIEAQAAYETIQQDLPVLSEALPLNPEPIRAVVQLRGLASDSGVAIVGLSVPPVELQKEPVKSSLPPTGKVNSIPISLSVNGSYIDIKNFLLGIGNLRRITQITGITFAPKRVSSEVSTESATQVSTGTRVQVDLKLNVFYATE